MKTVLCSRCGKTIEDDYKNYIGIFCYTIPCCRKCVDWLYKEFNINKTGNKND